VSDTELEKQIKVLYATVRAGKDPETKEPHITEVDFVAEILALIQDQKQLYADVQYKNGFYAASGMAGLTIEQTDYSWKVYKVGSKDPKNMEKALIATLKSKQAEGKDD